MSQQRFKQRRDSPEQFIKIQTDSVILEGMLGIPSRAQGLVLFAHGSGSSRLSPRNNVVARELRRAHLATLLLDLLTEEEDRIDRMRFDIDLLTHRLEAATEWVMKQEQAKGLRIGYFGASTGAAAALKAAASLGHPIGAVVSRGGRPDLAASALADVQSPVLLIVGSLDEEVIQLNRQAYAMLTATKELTIVDGASHLFEEPGTLEQVADVAAQWFGRYLTNT